LHSSEENSPKTAGGAKLTSKAKTKKEVYDSAKKVYDSAKKVYDSAKKVYDSAKKA
jgi:hypothetical protein